MTQARHPKTGKPIDTGKLDQIVASARRASDERASGYRAQALKLYPWVCGRCGREFSQTNLRELTVHHKDMDHDNNPPDGSNWELLCLYCHDNEHQKFEEHLAALGAGRTSGGGQTESQTSTTYRPFDALGDLLRNSSSQGD
ncbi:YajD family HNH nuclease [Rhabdochromatium marinum]|uniref:YajD family HNH nuclease n=1 Tax=Rhabdochromatium marinum TaxID=48729 RepID=UPI001905D6AB|nr:YajD family HNH nuclease [Rhabdochromatium marinum]MBK1647744.1 HNH endonuclease [Rhabdochromatium marinum]